MTQFPNEVFTTILSYCDDRTEVKQRRIMKNIVLDINTLYEDTYVYGNMTFEETKPYLENFENYTKVKFCYSEMAETYELGAAWLIKHFHEDDAPIWETWTNFYPPIYY